MILRLLIAFTRWVWGVSPAFVTADSEMWYTAMCFGAFVDVAVVTILTVVLVDWVQNRRKK
jgi:hypothetical protein